MRRPRAPAPAGIWSASVYSWACAPYIPQCILDLEYTYFPGAVHSAVYS